MIADAAANPDERFFQDRLAAAPTITERRQLVYWTAFQELASERINGMSVGRIPRSKIRSYCREELNMSTREVRAALKVLTALDSLFLSILADKASNK